MSDIAALIADMVRAGVDPDLIGRTAATIAEANAPKEPVLTKRQARNKRYYDSNKPSEKRLKSSEQDDSDDLLSPEGSSPTPPSPKPQSSIPPSPPKGGSSPPGFADFWAIFPNRVGRRDAEKAFVKALQRADLETILTGLRRYAAKTDDRPWCNPATFLNQDRWADQPADAPPRQSHSPPKSSERTVFDVLDDLKSGKLDVPDLLNGKSHEPAHPTIDTSFERTDRGGSGHPVQIHALPSGRRS